MKTPTAATPTNPARPTPSTVAAPEPPKVQRLNPLPLLLGALILGFTLFLGAFMLTRRAPAEPARSTTIEPTATEPAFLDKPRRDAIDPSLSAFDERREREFLAQIDAAQNGALGGSANAFNDLPYTQPPSYQPAAPPPPDLDGEALTRALRAPVLVPTSLSSREGTAGTGSLLDQLGLPRAPGLAEPPNFEQLARASLDGASASPFERSPQGQARSSLPRPNAETTTFADVPRTSPPSEQDSQQAPLAEGTQRLRAGTVVPAMLLTGIDSSIPGMVVAQVERNVFSEDLREVVIPRGSRLLGRADQQVALGQRRLLIAWTALLLADGRTIQLPGLPSHATSGEVGVAGRVKTHALRAFGNAVLLSLVSAGIQIAQPDRSGGVFSAPTPQEITAGAIGQNLAQVATEILRRDLQRAPTIRLEAGTRFVVFLNQDLAIEAGGAR